MAQPSSLGYYEALDQLTRYGLDPPKDTLGIVALGGDDEPRLTDEFLNSAMSDVNLDLGLSNSGSATVCLESFGSSNPSSSAPKSGGQSTSSGQRKGRQQQRTRRINEYYEVLTSASGSREKTSYRCRRCDYEVTQQKQRERLFHLMLCRRIPFFTRVGLYKMCNAKDRPPLLRYPLHHMTAGNARMLIKSMHEAMLGNLNCLRQVIDPSREPRLARYLLDIYRVKKSTPIGKCSDEETAIANDLLLDFIVDENMPFSICDNRENIPRPFRRLLSYLRPGYKLPSGASIRMKLLDEYYINLKEDIQLKLRTLLQTCRGTVMFDGSEDINGAPMINILLRVMGNSRITTSTYFLSTVYTGYDTVNANYYVKMTEDVLKGFGGFDYIAGVVTDNTGSVKNAREMLESKYPRLVASQDQAHVADRLLGDFGELTWIREIHEKLSAISSILKRYRKLRAKMMEFIADYNRGLRLTKPAEIFSNDDNPSMNTVSQTQELGNSEAHGQGEDEISNCVQLLQCAFPDSTGEDNLENDNADGGENGHDMSVGTFGLTDQASYGQVRSAPRTAVTMKKPSNVRFASSEKLLDEYVRLRPVLLRLIADSSFDQLYAANTAAEKKKKNEAFIGVIRDENFLVSVKQVHDIFRACRTYLRIFDAETAIASEVFEATRILKQMLEALPLESFPEPRHERRAELLAVFENRRIGPLPGRKKIKINLLSDLHIAAVLLDPYRTPINIRPYMKAFQRHLQRYLSGLDMQSLSLEESQREELFASMIEKFLDVVRPMWLDKGMMQEGNDSLISSDLNSSDWSKRSHSPLVWWSAGWLHSPPQSYLKTVAMEKLIEFAVRTLSVSPTATATERTFSLENHIHTKQRSSLSQDRVSKILFCQWNSRVLRRSAQRDEIDKKWELDRQLEGMRKLRSLRSAFVSGSKNTSQATAVRPTSVDQNRNFSRSETANRSGSCVDAVISGCDLAPRASTSDVGWSVADEVGKTGLQPGGDAALEQRRLANGGENTFQSRDETEGDTLPATNEDQHPANVDDTLASQLQANTSAGLLSMPNDKERLVSELIRLRNAIDTRLQFETQSKNVSDEPVASDVIEQSVALSNIVHAAENDQNDTGSRKRKKTG